MEEDLQKKMEDDLKKIKNEDDIKKKIKKMKTTSNKICSWFLLNLGQTFLGLAQLSKISLLLSVNKNNKALVKFFLFSS
jgi:hypothetical protein